MTQLMEWLDSLVNWKPFGLFLPSLPKDVVEKIEADKKDTADKKIVLYSKWLDVCPNGTWEDVITALEKAKENSLAESIKQKLSLQGTN